jgi:transcriptional regulator with XRE-family HTH domain
MAKSKWEEVKEKLILVEGWARDGLTEEQIAKNLSISRSTLNDYKKKYPDFLNTLKRGKEVIDYEVENALLKRALGYEYTEVTKERIIDRDDKGQPLVDIHGFPCYKMVVTKTVKKEIAPDTTAQIFWLKNRKPKDWKDKKDIDHSGKIDVNNPYKDLTSEELKKLAKMSDESG